MEFLPYLLLAEGVLSDRASGKKAGFKRKQKLGFKVVRCTSKKMCYENQLDVPPFLLERESTDSKCTGSGKLKLVLSQNLSEEAVT